MIQRATPPWLSGKTPSVRPADPLTHVELIWVEKQTENWIRFGHVARERILDRQRRTVSFAPGSIFALVRWASNSYGTVLSRLDILRATSPGEPIQTLPFVRPGGHILLTVHAWPKVGRVLQIIDAIEALDIDPVDVPADHWRHVHNRLTARLEPRAYTAVRHIAWTKRQRVGQ